MWKFAMISWVACVACSSSSTATPMADAGGADAALDDASSADALADADADFGQPSTTYPAFMPRVPQIVASGGPVMASVRVVPVFFSGDPLQAQLVDFLGKLAASPRWSAAVAEYGAGALSIATPVVLSSAAPTSIDDAAIRRIIATGLDGTHAEWGPTDPATLATSVYVLNLPASAKFSDPQAGASCIDINGYHAVSSLTGGFFYATVWACTPGTPPTGITSHELFEAATDPYVYVQPAYRDVDDQDITWELFGHGGEVADMCGAVLGVGGFVVPDLGYKLARAWSNSAMKGFHDPCVPRPDETPFFASIPRFDDDVDISVDKQQVKTKALFLKLGSSKTVDVDLLSDAPTSAWTISATDALAAMGGQAASVKLSLDRTTGVNGNRVHLTVTATAIVGTYGGTVVDMASTLGTTTRHWYASVFIAP